MHVFHSYTPEEFQAQSSLPMKNSMLKTLYPWRNQKNIYIYLWTILCKTKPSSMRFKKINGKYIDRDKASKLHVHPISWLTLVSAGMLEKVHWLVSIVWDICKLVGMNKSSEIIKSTLEIHLHYCFNYYVSKLIILSPLNVCMAKNNISIFQYVEKSPHIIY
jgi:hypothetical protein